MFLPRNQKNELQPYSDKVWLSKPLGNTRQWVHICMPLEDGSFAAFYSIKLEADGVYYDKDTAIGRIDDPSFQSFIDKLTGSGSSTIKQKAQENTELFARTCQSYMDTASIKKTAKAVGISEEKARKILITEGLYTCKPYENIKTLLAEGKSLAEISEQLNMTLKQVRTYLPYA